jgi:thymidylate synthase (FAD)
LISKFINNPFCTCVYIDGEYTWFISTNCQFVKELDPKILRTLDNFIISEDYIYKCAKAYPELLDIIRVSFEIQTQISTSRELNRVSPNNICEQSTRFCNFSKDKFSNNVTFCQPHWFDALRDIDDKIHEYVDIYVNEKGEYVQKYNDGEERKYGNPTFAAIGFSNEEESQPMFLPIIDKWVACCYDAEEVYFRMLKEGMPPQDARGILPLDTATKLFYTYSVKEWKHILDLRYKGTTGKPHPNAKIIATEIYNKLKELNLLGDYE